MDIDGLVAALKRFDALLASPELEPDPARPDWRTLRPRVEGVVGGFRAELLDPFRGLRPNIDDPELAAAAQTRVANQAAAVAGLLGASGDLEGAAKLCAEAASMARPSETSTLLYSAADEPEALVLLQYARWLQRQADPRSEKLAKSAKAKARSPVLKQAADAIIHAPKPIKRAPPLFRLNGCGASVYGAWDRDDEGFYTTVYCVCLLWIPVLPIAAYRVRETGSGSYQFLYRDRLGALARLWQGLVGAGFLVGGGLLAYSSYTSSETYLAHAALVEAQAAEARGERDDALTRYRGVTSAYVDSSEARDAAAALVRLSLASLQRPCTAASVEPARRLLSGVLDVPAAARRGEPDETLEGQLVACAEEVDSSALPGRRARLALLDLAADIRGAGANAALAKSRAGAEHALAQVLAPSRPVDALAHEIRALTEPEARVGAEGLVAAIAAVPSLALDAETYLLRFDALVCRAGVKPAACDAWQGPLEEARNVQEALAPALETGDEKAVVALGKTHPQSHEVAVALSSLDRMAGRGKQALQRLLALGAPGALSAEAQQALAMAYADQGELARADEVLTALVDERLAAFQAAQRAYLPAISARQEALIAGAKAGLYADLEARAQGKTDREAQTIFVEWLTEQVQKDPELAKLRTAYLEAGSVVPAVLRLGMLKVRRASDLAGDERTTMLREAEVLFLAIRGEAEGDPTFHMGLGQVYHRLGRTEEGEKELQTLLTKKDPSISSQVAMTYRELGLEARARAVLEEAYTAATDDADRFSIALSRSNVSVDLDDQQTWTERSDAASEIGKVSRLSVRAAIALRDGKRAEAAKLFGEEAAFYERNAKHSAPAANNAAIAYGGRYAATGDVADLRRAVTFLESAVKLEPDNAILLGHLADVQQHLGLVVVLDRFVHNKRLGLQAREALDVAAALAQGPLKETIGKAVAASPAVTRALSLSRDEQVLAPGKQSAYERAMGLWGLMGDEASYIEMTKRIEAAPAFDGREAAETRRRWESGEDDVKHQRSVRGVIATCERRLVDAKAEGHGPTLGAALLLCADSAGLAVELGVPFPAGDEVTLLEQAAVAYPELASERSLALALITRGARSAASASAPLADALKAEARGYGIALTLHRVLAGPSGAEVRKALLAESDVARGIQLASAHWTDKPGWSDYVLAELAGDAEKLAAVRGAMDIESVRRQARVGVKMYPGLGRETALSALAEGDLEKRAP